MREMWPGVPGGREERMLTDEHRTVENPEQSAFARDLDTVLASVRTLLRQKNAAYGDSALNPIRLASKASPEEQLLVRIDDKLSRLGRGDAAGEDVWADLLGYLVLREIAKLRQVRGTP